jgi:hypothetical protein
MNDEKFTNFSISLFEKCNPYKNTFIIGRFLEEQKFKIYEAENIKNYLSGSEEYFNYINQCDFDILIVHYLDHNKCKVINNLKSKKIIVWLAWGGDIYNSEFYKQTLYQPYTEQIVRKLNNNLNFKVRGIIKKVSIFLLLKKDFSIVYKNAVKKVDYCATIIPFEYEILRQWKFFKAKQVFFSNGSFEDDLKDTKLLNSQCNGNGILIGNSISPSSNHLDVFKKLKKLNLGNRKIIVPLNYGNETKYRDEIMEVGKNMFKDNWLPLLTFISKKEYIKVLMNCNIAIMNHERQQGIGNLVLLFWLGCKIFLSEKSLTYKYFKDKGFIVYSFQNDLNDEILCTNLSENEINKNRELIRSEYSNEKVIERTMELINTLKNSLFVN